MNDRLRPLANSYFILALIVLLTNDFYLKYEYHNWITGKLSDVAGLFVFGFFWSVVFPGRKKTVYFLTALGFVFWKSPYSETFINFFSEKVYSINRTIDGSDLLALLILPMSYSVRQERWIKSNIVPIPIVLLTIFSFCATSVPRPSLSFDRPEYVLFRLADFDYLDTFPNEFKIYRLDTMVVVAVTTIELDRFPALHDDYHKSYILSDLDLRALRASKRNYKLAELSSFKSQRDSLTIVGNISITLDLDSVSDELIFRGTRLYGAYKRYSKEKHLLIEGRYKDGIQDSTWTFHSRHKNVTMRQYFSKGELTRVERFHDGRIVAKGINTRKDSIMQQYFLLGAISVLLILIVIRLFLNFKASGEISVSTSNFAKVTQIILLPTIVFTTARIISGSILKSDLDIFQLLALFVLTNMVLIPMLAIVHYAIRLRGRFDLILYILFFVFALIWIEQFHYLRQIIV